MNTNSHLLTDHHCYKIGCYQLYPKERRKPNTKEIIYIVCKQRKSPPSSTVRSTFGLKQEICTFAASPCHSNIYCVFKSKEPTTNQTRLRHSLYLKDRHRGFKKKKQPASKIKPVFTINYIYKINMDRK